jgi:hypothetical protein
VSCPVRLGSLAHQVRHAGATDPSRPNFSSLGARQPVRLKSLAERARIWSIYCEDENTVSGVVDEADVGHLIMPLAVPGGAAARFIAFCSCGPVQKWRASSSYTATSGVAGRASVGGGGFAAFHHVDPLMGVAEFGGRPLLGQPGGFAFGADFAAEVPDERNARGVTCPVRHRGTSRVVAEPTA